MMNKNKLSVRLHGKPVGLLEQTLDGKKKFSYLSDVNTPISISMPIREAAYDETACEAFFGGLLPESETTKQIIGKKYGISPNNSFALLRAIGYDCAGAISFHSIDEPIVPQQAVPLQGTFVTDKELYGHIEGLPNHPMFMDVEGLRLSLAGVQDKAAVCLIENEISFPRNGCPTSHILKPNSLRFDGMTVNEFFVMKIAKKIGLPVPEVELRKIKDITFLLIERYDRRIKNNTIERIHQEDFCQALGILSSRKYQNEGGPAFKDCFNLLSHTTHPAINRSQLASIIIFNYLIGNMDAHGKNFSLLYPAISQISLAPFYDLVSTRVYPALTTKMAMKIGKQYDADLVFPKHWKELCERVDFSYLAMANSIIALGKQMKEAALQEKEQLKSMNNYHPIVDMIIDLLQKNIEQTLMLFEKLEQ